MALMTKSDYAAQIGVSKAYLSKPEVKARLAGAMVEETPGKLKIDSEKADAIFKITQDPARAHVRKRGKATIADADEPAEDGIVLGGYEKSRSEREALRVEEARLNLLERKNETLVRSDVVRAISIVIELFKESLVSRNLSLSEQTATMKDSREIKVFLDKSDRALLEMLSDEFEQRILPDGEKADFTLN